MQTNLHKNRVLVAMSGGIDSTVAAVMLHKQGYEVIGMTMKTWDYASSGGSKKETGCCSLDSINDAREVAVDFGFPHYIIDIREEFGESVINYFVEEYIAGRTPNPCVMCNTHIKWNALLRRADALGCAYIATGHYAQARFENDRWVISKGIDAHKDQSYVLWGLSQENLARNLFPVGKFQKSAIRQMAADWGYQELAKKAESYEICFVPDNDYRGFLKRQVHDLEEKVQGGNFIDTQGNIIGTHQGYPFYTIGQRKGLGEAFGKPMYVTDIDAEKNIVVLGELNDLQRNGMWVRNVNLIKYPELYNGMDALVKIRYQDKGAPAHIRQHQNGKIEVHFFDKVSAIAPGQSAVFYEGNDVIGGGDIETAFDI
ncbi:MAG: tRNA 2-thiouridine(34) synthase MnmA [Chitinophagales bacterium]|nr:tRNA 2-thiouridine(34) synthase MnmA [Bacteroidota bacterium]MCB9042794.1 tRNA 2-thiouridine(34) synthase MnmA [Chitinophagales bacterium]